jgi:hypothetical protein
MKRRHAFPTLILLLVMAGLACSIGGGGEDDSVATLSASLDATATARSAPVTPSPAPVSSPTADLPATLAVIQAEATSAIAAATVASETQAEQQNLAATATEQALAPIRAELASYGLDPNQGILGWVHPPLTIQTEGYMQYDYGGEYLSTVARDFVLAADITWNTRFGTTGCGYVLRSDGAEESYNQYMVIATRGASGHVGFIIMVNGKVRDNEITDIYANGIDPLFEWQNDTTNRMVVIGRGGTFQIFTNGTFIGEVTPSVFFERGFVAFVALNESGDTTCMYDNAWLWLLS